MSLHEDCIPASVVDQKLAALKAEIAEALVMGATDFLADGGFKACTHYAASRLSKPNPPAVELPPVNWEHFAQHDSFDQSECVSGLSWPNLYRLARLIVEGKARVVLTDQENSTRG